MATEQVCDRCDGIQTKALRVEVVSHDGPGSEVFVDGKVVDLCAVCVTGLIGWFNDGKRQRRLRGSQAPR